MCCAPNICAMSISRMTSCVVGAALSSMVLAGCPGDTGPAEDPRAISAIEPVNPTGTLTGQLLDLFTQAPIDGATVTLAHAAGEEGTSATTAADGTFELLEVSASASIGLLVEAAGYASAWTTVSLPNSAGNLAQDNAVAFAGPLHLLPLAEGVTPKLRVLDTDGGLVEAATVTAQLDVRFLDDGVPEGQLQGSAGYLAGQEAFVITGLPDLAALASSLPGARLRASIVPVDTTLNPAVVDVTVAEMLAAGRYTVVLEDAEPDPEPMDAGPEPDLVEADTPLAIVFSNVADLIDADVLGIAGSRVSIPSSLNPNQAISLITSRAIDEATFFISVVDGDDVAIDVGPFTVNASDELNLSTVTIGAPAGGWPAGEELNVVLEALIVPGSGPPQAPLVRQGSFLTAPSGPIAINGTGAIVNNAGTTVCPTGASFLLLSLNGQVGGRFPDGGAALGRDDLLAARASSTSVIVQDGSSLDDGYDDAAPASAELLETGAFAPSGYTDTLRIPFGGAFTNLALSQGQLTVDLDITIDFNDLETSNLNGSFGDVVARVAGGAPAGSLTATVTFDTNNAGAACIP
jgi:hypothetical protein